MLMLKTRNVNTAYPELMGIVVEEGEEVQTRNGPALALTHPLLVHFTDPCERVLFDPLRNANPFFHLVEALWMLAGRNDTKFLVDFNSNMATYSDDGITFNAAYGDRWRNHFGYDQITRVCDMLRRNPDDRRCVIAMWDAWNDLGGSSKDLPCNTQIMPRIVHGRLDFLITNRSNDLIFGLCGANAVHMSILQEYMAAKLGIPVGEWYHITNNLHVYDKHYHLLNAPWGLVSDYPRLSPLVEDWEAFDADCKEMCGGRSIEFREPFFRQTVTPMLWSWKAWKGGNYDLAVEHCVTIGAIDWNIACIDWLTRAQEKRNAK